VGTSGAAFVVRVDAAVAVRRRVAVLVVFLAVVVLLLVVVLRRRRPGMGSPPRPRHGKRRHRRNV
jgi:membrane protein implicated in regulation of membrane protease activity